MWWTAADFANVTLRNYQEIFGDVILGDVEKAPPSVVPRAFGSLNDCTEENVPLPPQQVPMPRLRLAKGAVGMLSIVLNTITLSRAWMQVPVGITELPGALTNEWYLFLEPPPDHVTPGVSGWLHHHTDKWLAKKPDGSHEHDVPLSLLGHFEFFALLWTLAQTIHLLSALRYASTHSNSRTNFEKWNSAADGFTLLRSLSTVNVIKFLPQIKQVRVGGLALVDSGRIRLIVAILCDVLQRPVAIWKRLQLRYDILRKDTRYSDHGKLSRAELVSLGVEGVCQAIALLVLAVLALLALYLKLEQLREMTQCMTCDEVTHLGPHEWSGRNWLQFIGFANQMMGIVDIGAVELQAVQLFIFTGADAVMQAEEAESLRVFHGRLLKTIFWRMGYVNGCFVAATMTSQDFQKLVIKERFKDWRLN